ncbi:MULTISPECIES: hypothetical protein [unclassified Fusibacter]|uniref:hypothetical protein n=1 Tax=unclassified Fusibacter TaxID=2624464 RepID=UPI0010137CC6|nr:MULTISPECIES: hypothetical protein [unclassified Fusibacter]MCK8061647.1 hypothetical protein [Fusibacter sp. A2]NPE23831.1 hypothetical protein [Fusibacter sp. A1]RXV58604.1 hypothetical protein DWB64_18770 [Fusibacter sp. A1]
MYLYLVASLYMTFIGVTGLYKILVLKKSPLHNQHQNVQIKNPVVVKRFYVVKHLISAIGGIAIMYVIGILKDPFYYPIMTMALSLYIGVELVSIYVNGKYV